MVAERADPDGTRACAARALTAQPPPVGDQPPVSSLSLSHFVVVKENPWNGHSIYSHS